MTTRVLIRRFIALRALRWLPLGVALPFLVLLPQDRGLGLAEIGVVFTAHSIVAIVLEVPSVGLADAVGRRATLVAGGLLNAAGLAGFAFATGTLAFIVAAATIAAGRALISGSLEAWFVDAARTIDPDLVLHRPLARSATVEGIVTGLGAAAGGLLPLLATGLPDSGDATLVRLSIPMLGAAAAAVVYVVAVLRLVDERSRPQGSGWRDAGATTAAGLRAARGSRVIRTLLGVALALGVVMSTTEVLWQPRLEHLLGGDAHATAPLFGALAAVSLLAYALGSAVSPRIVSATGRRRAFPGAFVALAAGLGLLAFVGTVALFCAAYLFYFAALGVVDPLHQEAFQDAIEGPNRATVTSAEGLAMQLGGVGGNLMLVPLAAATGIGLVWSLTAGIALLAAGLAAAVAAGAARVRPRPRPAAPSGAA